MHRPRNLAVVSLIAGGVLLSAVALARAAVVITGTVGPSGKYLVTGAPIVGASPAVLKFAFQNLTAGTNLSLCAGSDADFTAGNCSTILATSGGPGFAFITIMNSLSLSGKVLFVKRNVGALPAKFSLAVE